jgi:HlyD family secretion protein
LALSLNLLETLALATVQFAIEEFTMNRRSWLILVAILGILLIGGGLVRRNQAASEAVTPSAEATLPPVRAGGAVVADARVVPLRSAALSLPAGGLVRELFVEDGDSVQAGARLLRADSAREASAVLQAEAQLARAEAEQARLAKGADAESIAAADAAVLVAWAEERAAKARVASASANLGRTRAGAGDAVAIAERRVEQAENSRWGLQAQRDAICGRVKEKIVGTQADCDQSQARIQEAEALLKISELELQRARRGAGDTDVAVAAAQLREAESVQSAAQARAKQREAELARLKRGATEEESDIAKAGVDAALAALEQARLQMDDAILRAPFAGQIAAIDAHVGERVVPGEVLVRLADTNSWRIETEDLTELDVVGIELGDPALVSFDAIRDLLLEGRVSSIRSFGESRLGDITYRVTIELDKEDARLRWNMTAAVEIQTK